MGVLQINIASKVFVLNNLFISVNSFRYQQLDNYQRRSLAPVR
jgi:hypothetical protein